MCTMFRTFIPAAVDGVACLIKINTTILLGSTKCKICFRRLQSFRDGNPLVYGGAISRVEGDPIAGDVVDVIDSSGKFIAWGEARRTAARPQLSSRGGRPVLRPCLKQDWYT